MKVVSTWCSVLIIGINTWLCHGQTADGPNPPPNPAAVFLEFCDANTNFIAEVELHNADSKPEHKRFTPSKLWVLGKLARLESDLMLSKNSALSPAAIADLKQSGLSKAAIISRPDLQLSYVLFPDLNAYSVTPLTNNIRGNHKVPTVIKTELGRESLDGKECIKTKLILTKENGEQHQAIIWKADAEDILPYQFQATDGSRTTTLRITSIRFVTPERKLFEPPPHFNKCENMAELMNLGVMKRIGTTQQPRR